ncbi:energy transducer TonB [Algoriphagus lacus]|uniref:Energy transducer TonB n=1 Tax=Algoriphagus lacus TaxID=2056311 RepID=A0A418PP21_9BACT|nr:energy transducer TonB [Algoriphagus lacus]RIW13677.1 energy transducer TonB [Algoriphagus lacus]
MELKKNTGSDLRRWSAPLFNFGLIISVGSVLVAFEWKDKIEKPLLQLSIGNSSWESEVIPITIQSPPPVIPPSTPVNEFEVIEDDVKIEDRLVIDIGVSEYDKIPEIKLDGPPEIETAPEILDFTEVQAKFKGGMDAWYTYLKNNLTYPKQAQKVGIEGTVIVRFVINTDGSIQDVEVVRSIDSILDKAAIDVIQNSPEWNPAIHHGRPVRSRMTIPIKFKLN